MRDLKLSKDFVVTLHNDLVQARFRESLTLNEQKILFAVLSNIEPAKFEIDTYGKKRIAERVEEIEPFRIPIKEFTEWLGVTDPNYATFKRIVTKLKERSISIEQKDGSWEVIDWISRASYKKSTGMAEIKLSDELYPYVLNLSDNFTTVRLDVILKFRSIYTTKLYQMIKKRAHFKKWKVELDELKMLIGIAHEIMRDGNVKFKSLNKYSHFKERALENALQEINTYSEYQVDYAELKTGRKITAIEFSIRLQKAQKTPLEAPKNKIEKNTQENSLEALEEVTEGLKQLQQVLWQCGIDKTYGKALAENLQSVLKSVVDHPAFKQRLTSEIKWLFEYIQSSQGNSLTNPSGFVISKSKELVEKIFSGDSGVTYADIIGVSKIVRHGNQRIEQVPEWFKNRNQLEQEQANNKSTNDTILYNGEKVTDFTYIQLYGAFVKLDLLGTVSKEEAVCLDELHRLDEQYGIDHLNIDNLTAARFQNVYVKYTDSLLK